MPLRASELRDRLSRTVLIADGAMGTVLALRDVPLPYERACLTQAGLIQGIHEEYIAAGAQMIETATFGANRVKLAAHLMDRETALINREAVRTARAAAGSTVLVAGAMGPCGKALAPMGPIPPDLAREAFHEQASILLEEGVDLILLETFGDLEELRMAWQVVRSLGDVAIVAQKVFVEDGETLSGGLPARFAAEVGSWEGVAAVGANCAIGPQRMVEIVRSMAAATGTPISTMPTPGLPQRVGDQVRYAVTPEYFARAAATLLDAGACLIGGCCGTTPEHVAAIARAVGGRAVPRPEARSLPPAAPIRQPDAVHVAPSPSPFLARILENRYVTAVELDLPRGMDITRVIEGARALGEFGVDIIDIADGARARLRMNVICAAHQVQEQAGVEVMMHFACRDRNLLAVQADLLGARALGIRNILAVTGDPTIIGDYPAATSVYDVDSVGLVGILRRFNEGVDLAGNSIGGATGFTIAVAFDPLAADLPREISRLRRKRAEGAHVAYTQPIFDRSVLDTAIEAAAGAGIPLLYGLLPIRGRRHCEFMHNEVPGISIPDVVRARMAELSDEDARAYGLDVATEFIQFARSITQGVYLMPPFGNHRVAQTLLQATR